jgi:hypothetical protein
MPQGALPRLFELIPAHAQPSFSRRIKRLHLISCLQRPLSNLSNDKALPFECANFIYASHVFSQLIEISAGLQTPAGSK